jgi:hypothetical protein
MKKHTIFGLSFLALAVLVLAGCANKSQNQNGQSSSAGNQGSSIADNVKQKIGDLIVAGTGMKCTIQDPKMGELTMYAKGDKAKVEGYPYVSMATAFSGGENGQPPKQENGTMLNDGTWVYMWGEKDGMKFNIQEMKNITAQNQNQNQNQNQEQASDWKDWAKKMDENGTKYSCAPASLSDSDFVVPASIQFEDMGEMMKGFMQMGQDMQNKMQNQGTAPGQ